jgi:uncharacterized repeat protein (TIGR03803 family)
MAGAPVVIPSDKCLRFALVIVLAVAAIAKPSRAQTFTVLHTFDGGDGASDIGSLTRDVDGNLYGMTAYGGTNKCLPVTAYCGTAFKLNATGKQLWLYSFSNKGGRTPFAGLLRMTTGALYGTTFQGGDTTCYSLGCGTVFKLDNGKETVLHKFTGGADGYFPSSTLVSDAARNLYGTTHLGGDAGGLGTVFKIDSAGKETILHSFAGPPEGGGDGAYPDPGVIRDEAGNLYGVTGSGGAFGDGTVYEIDAAGQEKLLYSFSGGTDGNFPYSVLTVDSTGNLYGTTQAGGNLGQCAEGTGCGVIFKLSPQPGEAWIESTLYAFCSQKNCTDGQRPMSGPLAMDGNGNLYGTTYFGGAYNNCNGAACGVVYKLDAAGNETVLHSFTGGSDGADPWAGVILDKSGDLYGTAALGGYKCRIDGKQGCGVVFKITPP